MSSAIILPQIKGEDVSNFKPKSNSSRPEFERQLLDTKALFSELKHSQVCLLLRKLITICNYSQIQMLWTSFQPLFHRDYLFMGQKMSPESDLVPISTAITRETRNHLIRTRAISRFHRLHSAHISTEQDVFNHNRLPAITQNMNIITSQANMSKNGSKKRKNIKPIKPDIRIQKIEEFVEDFNSWSVPERTALFRMFLTVLTPSQIYFLCTLLSVKQSSDILVRLPPKITLKILSYLTAEELATSSSVSKDWREMCLSNEIWREKCDRVRSEMSTPFNYFQNDFYEAYRKNEIRKQNWKRAQCSHIHLEGHSKKVLVVALHDKLLISAGADAVIKVWDVESQTLLQSLSGHKRGIWSLAVFTAKLIVSGSHDNTIKVWNIEAGVCLRTMYGHTGAVWAIGCKKHVLVTGAHDKLIKVWNLRNCSLLKTLKGHGSAVFAVDLSDDARLIFSGSADHSLRIWNWADGKCLRVLWTTNSSPVISVSVQGPYMVYTAGNNLTLWNINKNKEEKTYRGHKCRIENVKLNVKETENTSKISVLTGGRDGRVRHWSLSPNDHQVKTMYVHRDQRVNCIAFDKRRIVTALQDNTICLCDFRASEEEVISREST